MKSEEYLAEIRAASGLKRAVLKKITLEGKLVTFFLVTDLTYSGEDIAHAEEVSRRYVPKGCEARVEIAKSVPSEEGVRASIFELLKTRFPAAAAFMSPEDVVVERNENGGLFFLFVDKAERERFADGDILNVVSEELNRRFCGAWHGDYRAAVREEVQIAKEELPPAEPIRGPRIFEICNYSPIDGAKPRFAVYIADLEGERKDITICGTVTRIEERETKNHKPFFRVTVSDGTGQETVSYFTRKATLEKVRAVRPGDALCLTGNRELFNGSFSFTARYMDRGAPPEGFVPQSRPSRAVPARYTAVRPVPFDDFVQPDFFGNRPLPASFGAERFVVFDLETTGLNNNPAGGAMDRIIEVGAVKIEDGRISEKFSSFVSCPVKLSEEIVELTGIDDGMLVGAPDVKDVIADFFKFCAGCSLVGHNVQFDFRFIRYYGEQEGYLFENKQYDTLSLAQELLLLPNYKLNTVADHYGFKFNHHRAFDDAFVTAKIFMELIREKGELPR